MTGSTPMYRDLTVGDHGPDVAQLQSDLADLGFPSFDALGVFGHGTDLAVRDFYDHSGFSAPVVAASSPKHPQVMVPQAEIVFVPKLPAVVQHSSLILGQPINNPALTLSTGRLRALIPLNAAQVSLAHVGDVATLFVYGTTGTGVQIPAKVAALKMGSSSATAVLRPEKPLGNSLTGARVGARIVIASTRKAVLAVPVAALYTGADGQPVVTVIARNGRRVSIPVSVSPEIGGFVPVQPLRGRLAAGARVLVGE
ncbi:MAG TPA: peptidoglycan-binding domain-containing protein [Streptosporangiaceae bacterium]|nr:peptidoglycan-binding domain-containing protein [Streptosporangiaceae bacterium]